MEKIISFPLSIIHYLLALLALCVFHPIQWVCAHIIKGNSQIRVVAFVNFLLLQVLKVTGNGVRFRIKSPIPKGVPIIFASNHQSLNEIVPLIWYLREYTPRFVGKKELDTPWVPSIGIYLRNCGSVFVDRSKPMESAETLKEFGKYLKANNYAGLIFPEGTRSRNGELKPFKTRGLKTIMEEIPNGYVVPITINNSWKIQKYGFFPLGLNNDFNITTHEAIAVSSGDADEVIAKTRAAVLSCHEVGERKE